VHVGFANRVRRIPTFDVFDTIDTRRPALHLGSHDHHDH
jgi:hypothetical protein